MARAEKHGKAWLLVEDHCPICAAAATCQGLCRSELQIFARCLGDGRAASSASSTCWPAARRCAYRVSAGRVSPDDARRLPG